jgi:hypothetical protein
MTVRFLNLFMVDWECFYYILGFGKTEEHLMGLTKVGVVFYLDLGYYYLLFYDLGVGPDRTNVIYDWFKLILLVIDGDVDLVNRVVGDGLKFGEIGP